MAKNCLIKRDKDGKIERVYNPLSFQIIGEKGAANLKDAVVVLENLKVAKQMQQAGKDAKTIKLATGWEQSGKTDTFTSLTTEQKINFLKNKGELIIDKC